MWVKLLDDVGKLTYERGLISLFDDPIETWGLTHEPLFGWSVWSGGNNGFDVAPCTVELRPLTMSLIVIVFVAMESIVGDRDFSVIAIDHDYGVGTCRIFRP